MHVPIAASGACIPLTCFHSFSLSHSALNTAAFGVRVCTEVTNSRDEVKEPQTNARADQHRLDHPARRKAQQRRVRGGARAEQATVLRVSHS